jgi:hypothetical protein
VEAPEDDHRRRGGMTRWIDVSGFELGRRT